MARAGLPIAADEESECGFFNGVFTDVGDEQSTAANLSTFSAHITNLTAILREANSRTLVLLDELAGGTDPQEGAALGCALLEALLDRGAAMAVTTHYQPLKAMAGDDRRVRNASFGIDPERMAPSFALSLDVPGTSSALNIARRFGIPDAVIESASRKLPEQSRRLEELAAELGERMEEVRQRNAELENERAELMEARHEADRMLGELRERDRRALSRETRQLIGEVRQAREELERVKTSLKKRRLVKPEELARAAEQIGGSCWRPRSSPRGRRSPSKSWSRACPFTSPIFVPRAWWWRRRRRAGSAWPWARSSSGRRWRRCGAARRGARRRRRSP
jgi:DNA mismatch repair protein MutS2